MDNSRNLSGNIIEDNAAIFLGDFNYNTTSVAADSSNLEASLLGRLCRTDPAYDKRRILDLKGPLLYESFSWILEHDDFSKWNNSKESGVF
ncbi:hypothetical protein MKX08_005641 [Trichoderma sp. CBMAI-0020]|nr:hypothetical protein MKX08_005641 [Trichoderma sp. CBMAI-0020]